MSKQVVSYEKVSGNKTTNQLMSSENIVDQTTGMGVTSENTNSQWANDLNQNVIQNKNIKEHMLQTGSIPRQTHTADRPNVRQNIVKSRQTKTRQEGRLSKSHNRGFGVDYNSRKSPLRQSLSRQNYSNQQPQFADNSGILSRSFGGDLSQLSQTRSCKRRKQNRYLSHHINGTGPGDYNVPNFVATQYVPVSNHKNTPAFSLGARVTKKKPYFHQCYKDFVGCDSPNVSKYEPCTSQTINKIPEYSMGKLSRFQLPSSVTNLQSQLPVQYQPMSPAFRGKGASTGFGKKLSYKTSKDDQTTPGPVYRTDYINSLWQKKDSTPTKMESTFGITHDQKDILQYHGQEKHFFGRGTPGPGAYQQQNVVRSFEANSVNRTTQRYSMPKNDRGLLNNVTKRSSVDHQGLSQLANMQIKKAQMSERSEAAKMMTLKRDGCYSMPKGRRNIDLTKFSSQHTQLIRRGIY